MPLCCFPSCSLRSPTYSVHNEVKIDAVIQIDILCLCRPKLTHLGPQTVAREQSPISPGISLHEVFSQTWIPFV